MTKCANKISVSDVIRVIGRAVSAHDESIYTTAVMLYSSLYHVSKIFRTDLEHMVEIVEIACGTSWKSRSRSCIRNGEEVELFLPNTSEMIHMPSIAGRKRRNVIGPRHFSPR